jgi:hypothetical protein
MTCLPEMVITVCYNDMTVTPGDDGLGEPVRP